VLHKKRKRFHYVKRILPLFHAVEKQMTPENISKIEQLTTDESETMIWYMCHKYVITGSRSMMF